MIFIAVFLFTLQTYRINKIMKNARRFRKVKITVRETLIPMVASLIGEWFFAQAWKYL